MILSISNINPNIVQVILIFDFTLKGQWFITHTKGLPNMYGKQLAVNGIFFDIHKVQTNIGSVRGSPNSTIGNFTDGTIGSQWYHWLTNGTIGLPMVPIVPLALPMVPLPLPLVQMVLPMVPLVKP